MYVCMYVCLTFKLCINIWATITHVCMYVMYVCMYVRMYCLYVHMYVSACIFANTNVNSFRV